MAGRLTAEGSHRFRVRDGGRDRAGSLAAGGRRGRTGAISGVLPPFSHRGAGLRSALRGGARSTTCSGRPSVAGTGRHGGRARGQLALGALQAGTAISARRAYRCAGRRSLHAVLADGGCAKRTDRVKNGAQLRKDRGLSQAELREPSMSRARRSSPWRPPSTICCDGIRLAAFSTSRSRIFFNLPEGPARASSKLAAALAF